MADTSATAGKASRISAVDDDKLWRARISQELQHQRTWQEEYGFMVSNPSKGVSTAAASITPEQLEELKKSMKGTYLQSTNRSSFQQRPPIERYRVGEYNRKKFKDE